MAPRLLNSLDRDVYQIVRKFEDHDGAPSKFTITGVYDSIKKSNSSLARQKKRPLEDSIERVLRVRKEEKTEDDEGAAIEEAIVATGSPKPKERDYFLLNKQITKSWNVARKDADMTSEWTGRQVNGEPKPKRRKSERDDRRPPTDVSILDLAGMGEAIHTLSRAILVPMNNPEACELGAMTAARGVLLHGPSGCGKTMLAKAFAAQVGVAYIPVSAPSLVAGMSGESERKIRELYDEAKKLAPCIIFIDEIDVIMGKRENAQREMEKRMVAQMLTCMDELDPKAMGGNLVVTLAATNRPESIDPALRRAGRFDYEINIGIPNEAAREAIFRKVLQDKRAIEGIDFKLLAKKTPGFVGADLKAVVDYAQKEALDTLINEAVQAASTGMDVDSICPEAAEMVMLSSMPRNSWSIDRLALTMEHLSRAINKIQPSALREGFTTIPDTTWDHIGALKDARDKLMTSIVQPIQDPDLYARLGIGQESPAGVLLWGPPGCGKTLLAKAVANASMANFISVSGPELLNKYVGESERAIRQVFSRARASAPCILFFDELDAILPRRDGAGSDSGVRVVNQVLTEMDGINGRRNIYIIGATNRPDMIDSAILRPGRMGTKIFVDVPDADGRVDILNALIRRRLPHYRYFDHLETVARDVRCETFSGADLENLHTAAAHSALKRMREAVEGEMGGLHELTPYDWEEALEQVKPSNTTIVLQGFRALARSGLE